MAGRSVSTNVRTENLGSAQFTLIFFRDGYTRDQFTKVVEEANNSSGKELNELDRGLS